jgi:hypothetical protein
MPFENATVGQWVFRLSWDVSLIILANEEIGEKELPRVDGHVGANHFVLKRRTPAMWYCNFFKLNNVKMA